VGIQIRTGMRINLEITENENGDGNYRMKAGGNGSTGRDSAHLAVAFSTTKRVLYGMPNCPGLSRTLVYIPDVICPTSTAATVPVIITDRCCAQLCAR